MILAVDTFMRLNGRSSFGFVTEPEVDEEETRKRITFSSRGYKDLYSEDEEEDKDKKGRKEKKK